MSDALFDSLATEFTVTKQVAVSDNKIANAIFAALFPKQQQVVKDKHKRKAVLCPRRAGKSWTALSYSYYTALNKPWSNCLVVGLTLKSLRGIYWNRVLPLFEQTFGIESKKHHTEMRVRLPNGSLITWVGAETRAEIEKLRGQAYDLVIIDEAASFSPVILDELVNDVFRRGLMDRMGTIMLIGTPGSLLDGAFYHGTFPGAVDQKGVPYARTFDAPEEYWTKSNSKRTPRWSRHSWTVKENTALPHAWSEALNDKESEGWADDNPTWLREYMGQWVASDDLFVYRYPLLLSNEPSKVSWLPQQSKGNPSGLPKESDYRFVMGVDLGFEDDFALVVCAYSLTEGVMYHVYDMKLPHQDVNQVARHLVETCAMFENKIDAIVADTAGLGKMVVETINNQYGLSIVPAEKTEKYDFIELVNSDFSSGKIRIIPDSDLAMELSTLQWDLQKSNKTQQVRSGRLRENPTMANHLCFVAGTQILTSEGNKNVEDIKVGDHVMTRRGLRKVHTTLSSEPRPTVKVTLANGTTLQGTPDHPVLTDSGWRALTDLTPNDTLYLWANTDAANQLVTKESPTAGTLSPKTAHYATTTEIPAENDFIELYMKTTSAHHLSGATSTTSTVTLQTTAQAIYERYQRLCTYPSICESPNELSSPHESWSYTQDQKLQSGTGRWKGVHGTANTEKHHENLSLHQLALYAIRSSITTAKAGRFAEPSVTQRNDGRVEKTTPQASAQSVVNNLSTTNMPSEFVAPCRVLHVEQTAECTVYNLSVNDVHEYFANGVLVGNCDAFLYSWRYSYHQYMTPKTRNIPVNTTEYWDEIERRSIERLMAKTNDPDDYGLPKNDPLASYYGPRYRF